MIWRVLLHEWFVFTALGNILSILNILFKIMVESIWPVSQCEQENNYRDHHLTWIKNESKLLSYKWFLPISFPSLWLFPLSFSAESSTMVGSKWLWKVKLEKGIFFLLAWAWELFWIVQFSIVWHCYKVWKNSKSLKVTELVKMFWILEVLIV